MSRIDDTDRELLRLMAAACDGAATADDFAQLESRLQSDPQAQRLYFDNCLLTADLQMQQGASRTARLALAEIDQQAANGHKQRRAFRRVISLWSRPTLLSMSIAAVAMGLLVTAMAFMAPPFYRALRGPSYVADVLLARGVRWAPSSLVDGRPPERLAVGQTLELLEGTVALRFGSGALVVLEGPARFGPLGHNGLQLRRGKLAAHVPPPATGFFVDTATVRVVDLGTEFSVHAQSDETEVQVLTGSVQVHPRDAAGHALRKLSAGEAALFHHSSSQGYYVQETEMNRSAFLGFMMLAALGHSSSLASPYTDAVLADNPLVYYQFNETSGAVAVNSGTLGAAADATYLNTALNQAAVNPSLGVAAGFNGTTSRVRIPDQAAFDLGAGPFSVEMWYFTTSTTRGDLFTYKQNGVADFGIISNFNNTADTVRAGFASPGLGTSTAGAENGAWLHLVVTRGDGAADTLKLYIDGALEGTTTGVNQSWNIANDILIGANHNGNPSTTVLNFNGLIDEVAIYNTALTEAQVQAHFNAAAAVPESASVAIWSVVLVASLLSVCILRRRRR